MRGRDGTHTALKRAELLSALGAGVLGARLALMAASWLAPLAGWILGVGLVAHAVGMTLKHRLAQRERAALPWEQWLYRGCWGLLLVLAGLVAARWPG